MNVSENIRLRMEVAKQKNILQLLMCNYYQATAHLRLEKEWIRSN